MADILGVLIFMTLVVGLAAGILWLVDNRTLRGLTEEEKAATVNKRRARWSQLWRVAFVVMAAVSLPVNLVGLLRKREPVFPTIIWVVLAIIILFGVLSPFRGDDQE